MTSRVKQANGRRVARSRRVTRKDQIRSLYLAGITEVEDLALILQTRPSYVASVLQGAEQLHDYFDLYTSSSRRMNVYSKFFAGKLGFKDEEIAQHSVDLIDHFYQHLELAQDRAGQHHALLMALTMFDRARWTGKEKEADVFRRWLIDRLRDEEPKSAEIAPVMAKSQPLRRLRNDRRLARKTPETVRG